LEATIFGTVRRLNMDPIAGREGPACRWEWRWRYRAPRQARDGHLLDEARAFLLTLANARLGLWFGKPRDDEAWSTSEPPLGVGPVLRELLGLTTDNNPVRIFSDGGHYENLGLWEMVARPLPVHRRLGRGLRSAVLVRRSWRNAVRRIRLDLGIPIYFPPIDVTRPGQGHTNPHAAIGKIRYSVVDGPEVADGTILYLKATLSGDRAG
jgi:hypothetical protein